MPGRLREGARSAPLRVGDDGRVLLVLRDVEVHADQGALALEVEVGEIHTSANNCARPTFSSTRAAKSAIVTRSWAMVSRSRMVTAFSKFASLGTSIALEKSYFSPDDFL